MEPFMIIVIVVILLIVTALFVWKLAKKKYEKEYISPETARFLDEAIRKNVDIERLFKDPESVAKELELTITDTIIKDIKRLERAQTPGKMDKTDEEVVSLFNKVVSDGRYIHEFLVEPDKVASKLDVVLSKEAIKRIEDYRLPDLVGRTPPGSTVMSPYAVAIVVAAIIVLWSHDPRRAVIDESGQVKF